MKPFKILSREVLVSSVYCPVERQVVELPDGRTTDWYVNTSLDAVVIVPFLKSGEVLLQRCYRHGAGEIIVEFCAGLVDAGESALEAAKRELLEETGYVGDLECLGSCFANATGSTMKYHFFLARHCEKVAEQHLDPAEQIELFTVKNVQEVRDFFLDPKVMTSAAVLSALAFLSEQEGRK